MVVSKQVISYGQGFLQHLCPAVSKLTDIVVSHAKGSYIWAEDGKKYLDLTCGIGATSTGHCHPKVVAAIQEQAANIIHAQQSTVTASKPLVDLVERLQHVIPSQLAQYFFCSGGAEAVENAVKIARAATGRPNLIVFENSFHGRTMGTMAMTTSKTIYKAGFGPLMPGVFIVSYPYCLHCKVRQAQGGIGYRIEPYVDGFQNKDSRKCCYTSIQQFQDILQQQSSPKDTAAVIIEPIVGEGGFLTPPPGFLQAIQQICKQNDILFILDEVQSGVGRTGKWWGYQHFEEEGESIDPDILIFAKGIASGFPFAGLAAKANLFQNLNPGSMGSTYGSNAIGCAAAVATLDAIEQENMLENASKRGLELMKGLCRIAQETGKDVITDVRGRGLMVAVEFKGPKGFANLVTKCALKRQTLMLTAGAKEVVRFLPPLNISQEEVQASLDVFEASLKEGVELQMKQT